MLFSKKSTFLFFIVFCLFPEYKLLILKDSFSGKGKEKTDLDEKA